MDYPQIEFNGKIYYKVGCKKCTKGDDWDVYSDGKEFVTKCKCGNILLIKEGVTQREPELCNAVGLY